MGTLVFKPEEIYRAVRNVVPDLIVHFGGLAWRSVGGVGYRSLHVRENDTGPDDCNHAQQGAFILASTRSGGQGMIEGVHLRDIAPTLLQLGGYDRRPSMRGRSFATGREPNLREGDDSPAEDELTVRDRLSALEYI